jgi:hypothetical protein
VGSAHHLDRPERPVPRHVVGDRRPRGGRPGDAAAAGVERAYAGIAIDYEAIYEPSASRSSRFCPSRASAARNRSACPAGRSTLLRPVAAGSNRSVTQDAGKRMGLSSVRHPPGRRRKKPLPLLLTAGHRPGRGVTLGVGAHSRGPVRDGAGGRGLDGGSAAGRGPRATVLDGPVRGDQRAVRPLRPRARQPARVAARLPVRPARLPGQRARPAGGARKLAAGDGLLPLAERPDGAAV